MAARINAGRFIQGSWKFVRPVIPNINAAAVRNSALIHSFGTSLYKENLPNATSYGSQDILLSKIRFATESRDILEAVNQHHSIMNNRHTLQALRSIFMLQKSQSGSMSNREVIGSVHFRLLSNMLKSQIRHLEVNELIDCLKFFGYLGVPASSKIMQTVLQLVTKHINQLNLQQITFLDFVMKDFTKTPLVEALNIALPVVFEAHLMTMCDFKNIQQLAELFIFVSRRPVHSQCCRAIVEALTEQRAKIDLKLAKSIVRSFVDLQSNNEKDELLLRHSLDVITDSVDSLSFNDVESTIHRILSKYILGYDHFYHEEFLNACAKYIIDNECSFEQGLWILRKVYRFNHVSILLLDYLTQKALQEPWMLEQISAGGLISFISGLAQADYKPKNWDQMKVLVMKCVEMHQDRQELPWVKMTLEMCVMDCWSRPLFEKIFKSNFLEKFMSREYNTLDLLQFLLLHQCCSTLAPWTDGPSAPEPFLQQAIEINGTHHTSFPLLAALTQGLGDGSYVLSGVYTKLGHFLDYVVVLRKGGFPVAINFGESDHGQRKYVESLDLPPESTVVAVLFLSPSMSSINSERVRGSVRLQVNTVEALGISVVPVLHSVWSSLIDSEKIPYLMQAIRLKAEVNQTTPVIVPV